MLLDFVLFGVKNIIVLDKDRIILGALAGWLSEDWGLAALLLLSESILDFKVAHAPEAV